MLDRRGPRLPIACAGVSPRRPLVFWTLIATSLSLWFGLILLVHRLL